MATHVFFEEAMIGFATGAFNLLTDDIKMVLIRTGAGHYVANFAVGGDKFLSAIALADRVSISANLTGKVVSLAGVGGVLDADDTQFSAVPAGAACGAVAFFKDTGVVGTSRLICYSDDYAGLPYTPTGIDCPVAFPGGGCFQI